MSSYGAIKKHVIVPPCNAMGPVVIQSPQFSTNVGLSNWIFRLATTGHQWLPKGTRQSGSWVLSDSNLEMAPQAELF